MKVPLDRKSRKEIEEKMLTLLGETMQPLSKEFQAILVDDLVTAFESRLTVLNRIRIQTDCAIISASEIHNPLIKA